MIDSQDASSFIGGSFGPGKESTISDGAKLCTYGSETSNVFLVEVAKAPDEAAAKANKPAAAEKAVINIPIQIPSNSVALKGAFLKTIELDYEITTVAATSITASLNKITRGADTAGLTVAAVTITQDLVAATTVLSTSLLRVLCILRG